MFKSYIFVFSLIFFVFTNSCIQRNSTNVELEERIDSLEHVIMRNNDYIHFVEKVNPAILISNKKTHKGEISCFFPFGLSIKLCHERPKYIPEIFLCVPAAYTDPNNLIDGLYIEDGKVISTKMNRMLTGAYIISNDSIQIIDNYMMSNELIDQVKRLGKSAIQQTLLVKNSMIVHCDLFKKKKNIRRSLIQFEGSYCIGESVKPVTIEEFQESLISIGAINAIYLDMGSWSEGWYRDNEGEVIRIGENFANTYKQTSWLVFESQTN